MPARIPAGGAPRTRTTGGALTIADPRTCTERELMDKVVEIAQTCGWAAVHFGGNLHKRAWHDATGFPDLLLVHPGRGLIWFAELKSATGHYTERQERWRTLLIEAKLSYFEWRPADWPDIVQALSFGQARVA
jgi:hypothetical protein